MGEQQAQRATSPGCTGEQQAKRATSPGCMGEQQAQRATSPDPEYIFSINGKCSEELTREKKKQKKQTEEIEIGSRLFIFCRWYLE